MAGALTSDEGAVSGPVVCFGELLVRLSPPGARLMLQADTLDMMIGGAEANVAAALASLGHHVRMISAVAANPLGAKARAALAGAGVDVRAVRRLAGRMGLYFVEQGAGLRPSSITYDRAGSVFSLAEPEAFDFASALEGAGLLHVSGITPALGPNGVELARDAFGAAAEAGVPVCFDGNYRAQLWESWDSDPRALLTELVARSTILIGNHRDISLLLGRTFSGDGSERRRDAVEAAFEAFPALQVVASTARHVVAGGHHRLSARADLRDARFQTDEIEVTGIVERIGTGDAFTAGVLHAWLDGRDAEAMAQTGLALCALKHSLPGDMCLIGPDELAIFSPDAGDVRR